VSITTTGAQAAQAAQAVQTARTVQAFNCYPFKSLIFEINPCKIHHILIDSYILKRSLHEKV